VERHAGQFIGIPSVKKKIDRFVLLEQLAEGGGGAVWQAEEMLPGDVKRPVALKVLPAVTASDKAALARFVEEVKLLVSLGGSPNVVTVYAMGLSENVPWIAMEYLPQTLEQKISEIPGNPAEIARMIEDVATGVSALHGLTPALLHNDLKPSNILIDARGACKITDFSVASAASVERTRQMATVRYAAPELISRDLGKSCPATDLYALGHIAYELALGGKLYRQQFPAVYEPRQGSKDANPAKWMAWHCSITTKATSICEVLGEFPQHLSDIIAKLMTKPLKDRYAAAGEVLEDLKKGSGLGVQGSGTEAAPPPAPIPLAPVPSPSRDTKPENRSPITAPTPKPEPVTAPPPDPASLFYVRFRGRVSGPVDVNTLRRQIKQGLVSRLHQISNDRVTWRGIDTL
jgi:serine/threonine protein kinase